MATKTKTKKRKSNCETCKHRKYDETWGEHKCLRRSCRIYDIDKITNCEHYEKGSKADTD